MSGWPSPWALRRDAMTSSRIAPARSSCPEFARHCAWNSRHASVHRVVGAELRLPQRQRLLEELQRPVVLAGGGIADGEVGHALERVGVVGAELRLLQRQRLLESFSARSFWPACNSCRRGCSCSRACRGGRARASPSAAPGSPRGASAPGRSGRRRHSCRRGCSCC